MNQNKTSEKLHELPSDKTYKKYLPQWEKYKEAHNGYAQYLSYEMNHLEKENKTLHEAFSVLLEAVAEIEEYPDIYVGLEHIVKVARQALESESVKRVIKDGDNEL